MFEAHLHLNYIEVFTKLQYEGFQRNFPEMI